jgi:uncharacterized protein (DUF1330 family)
VEKEMPAYWVARGKVNDPAEYKKYADQVPAILDRAVRMEKREQRTAHGEWRMMTCE